MEVCGFRMMFFTARPETVANWNTRNKVQDDKAVYFTNNHLL